jgi:hypothetical protein
MKGARNVITNPNARRPVTGNATIGPNMVSRARGVAVKSTNQRQPQNYR